MNVEDLDIAKEYIAPIDFSDPIFRFEGWSKKSAIGKAHRDINARLEAFLLDTRVDGTNHWKKAVYMTVLTDRIERQNGILFRVWTQAVSVVDQYRSLFEGIDYARYGGTALPLLMLDTLNARLAFLNNPVYKQDREDEAMIVPLMLLVAFYLYSGMESLPPFKAPELNPVPCS